jgi:putative membrane protein insertion efficiency factor
MPAAIAFVRALPRRLLIGAVHAYRLLLKAWIGNGCRFEPSCSAYALQALERHGAAAGSYLVVARLARCHPWCEGGHDPVAPAPPALFSRRGLGARAADELPRISR